MLKRPALILLALSSFTLSPACSVPVRVALFNNSEGLVIVGVFDETTKIPPGETVEFRLPMHGGPFSLYTDSGRVTYDLNLRELRYDEFRTRWGGVVRVQLERDLRIFILRRGEKPPKSADALKQPQGFPVKPVPATWAAA